MIRSTGVDDLTHVDGRELRKPAESRREPSTWPARTSTSDPAEVPLELSSFAVVDFETTGLFATAHDRVIEIGIVRMNADGAVSGEFESLVNPGRDVGPTWLHGIRSRELLDAPTFAEIAGDVCALLDGAVVVAHNIRFERSFLDYEFSRAGTPAPEFAGLCTMALAGRLGLAARRLSDCCAAYSIDHPHQHSALGDARATARLLACLLGDARRAQVVTLAQLGCSPLPPAAWPILTRSGRVVTRREVAAAPPEISYLGGLVARLPSTMAGFVEESAVAYLDLLDRALEDRHVTADEAGNLEALAREWGIDGIRMTELHEEYLRGVVETALADRQISESERVDLLDVAHLLGYDEAMLGRLVLAAMGASATGASGATARPAGASELQGLSVCFTGQLNATIHGRTITREHAQELARAGGMEIQERVTKKLQILVVADPETMSGKAAKARTYGTRIMAERAFWQALGVAVD
jgi:DNA polymerase-3 subunit epsilon